VVGSLLGGAGDLGIGFPGGGASYTGAPQPLAENSAALEMWGMTLGEEDVIEAVADPAGVEGADPVSDLEGRLGEAIHQGAVIIVQGDKVGRRDVRDGGAFV